MADGTVRVAPDSTGKFIDATELTVGANTVERQRVHLAGSTAAALIDPLNSTPAGTEYALPVRNIPSGTQTIQGVQDTRTTGTITSATSVVGPLAVTQRNVITVAISGTYAGVTFVIEASDDGGTTYYPLQVINNATGQVGNTWTPGTNARASYDAAVGGYTHLRVRATAWTSGTANVGLTAQSFAYDPVVGAVAQGVSANNTATLGNPVLVGGWNGTNTFTLRVDGSGNATCRLTDGTNLASVKAASTAAAFTDVSLVVEQRPGGAMVSASAALADGLANPTLGQQAVLNSVFNGSTWDRQRGMGVATTTGDTGAKTATGNGATQTNVGNKGIQIVIAMGAVTGTTPTCVIKVQGSVDGGTNWFDIPGATTASLVATGVWGITIYPGIAVTAGSTTTGTTATANSVLPRTWRVVWTIGGTTPSFTITSITYNYIPN